MKNPEQIELVAHGSDLAIMLSAADARRLRALLEAPLLTADTVGDAILLWQNLRDFLRSVQQRGVVQKASAQLIYLDDIIEKAQSAQFEEGVDQSFKGAFLVCTSQAIVWAEQLKRQRPPVVEQRRAAKKKRGETAAAAGGGGAGTPAATVVIPKRSRQEGVSSQPVADGPGLHTANGRFETANQRYEQLLKQAQEFEQAVVDAQRLYNKLTAEVTRTKSPEYVELQTKALQNLRELQEVYAEGVAACNDAYITACEAMRRSLPAFSQGQSQPHAASAAAVPPVQQATGVSVAVALPMAGVASTSARQHVLPPGSHFSVRFGLLAAAAHHVETGEGSVRPGQRPAAD
jgi:regulator of replication initiation timing